MRIVYFSVDGNASLVTPAPGQFIDQVVARTVPDGVDYLLVEEVPSAPVETWVLVDGVIAVDLSRLATTPDYPAFRSAIAQLPAWRSLVAGDGRAAELSRCLGEQDLDTAAIWWADLVNDGKVSDELKAAIAQAAISASMPEQLLQALA